MLFGQYIKQLREVRGIGLSDAARQMGIERQRLWDIENGIRYPNKVPRHFLNTLSKVYKVPLGIIVESTKVKVQEKQILSEHLADTRPIVARALRLTGEIASEARMYTPELERDANALYELLTELKQRVDNAYFSLYPSTRGVAREAIDK